MLAKYESCVAMADHEGVFVYTGEDQLVPFNVVHVRVHESVNVIPWMSFFRRTYLVSVEMHDGVEIIKDQAFYDGCYWLRRIKLPGVRVIEHRAFAFAGLTDVEFGDKLEMIGRSAFKRTALRNLKIPKVRDIKAHAFMDCRDLLDAELSEDLEKIRQGAFQSCRRLSRIVMPLKADIFDDDSIFEGCDELSTVALVGGIHKTISSLHLESWRNEMNDEIYRINQVLPNTPANEKTAAIRHWMRSVLKRIAHYKSEHYALLKEAMALLELALWKAKLEVKTKEEGNVVDIMNKKAARMQDLRITSGASVVIKNVLPFLALQS